MFDPASRYRDQPVATDVDAAGVARPWVTLRLPPEAGATVGYVVRAGDGVDLLAYRAYGDPSLWWRIADANPQEVTGGPDGLVDEPGSRIALPQPVRPEVLP